LTYKKLFALVLSLSFGFSYLLQAQDNVQHPPKEPRYFQAFVQLGSILSVFALDSFIHNGNCFPYSEEAGSDFIYDSFWGSLKDKFQGKGVKFDDNARSTNIGHAFAGTVYYQIARSNGLSVPMSFLYGAGTFTIWELFVEYREVFSINDAIMTPFGGLAIGEPFFQISEFFHHSEPHFLNKLLSTLFNPAGTFNRWFNDEPEPERLLNNKGLARQYPYSIGFYLGVEYLETFDKKKHFSTTLGSFIEITHIYGIDKPGKNQKWLSDSIFSAADVQFSLTKDTLYAFSFKTSSVFAGYYSKNIQKEELGLRGYSFWIGPGMGLKLKRDFTLYKEWGALLDFMDIASEVIYHTPGFQYQNRMGVYASFSMFKGRGIDDYLAIADSSVTPDVFQKHQYVYGIGMNSYYEGKWIFSSFEIGLKGQWHFMESIQDRWYLKKDTGKKNRFELEEQDLRVQLWVAKNLSSTLKLRIEAELKNRNSEIEDANDYEIEKNSLNLVTKILLYYHF